MKNQNYLGILEADHKHLKALFKKFEHTDNGKAKGKIVETLLKELMAHMKTEETVVYPELRKVIEEDIMDEADIEHHVAKGLMYELSIMKAGDDHYDAKVTVLGELIDHHVKEEEGIIFPKARKSKKIDPQAITARVIEKKKELMKKIKATFPRVKIYA